MSARERLPNRRRCETVEFVHAGQAFKLSCGFFADAHLAEIFLSARHVGSPLEAITRDCAILARLALQHGAHIETLAYAMTKDHDRTPATAIGQGLAELCKDGIQ